MTHTAHTEPHKDNNSEHVELKMQKCSTYLEHLTANALPLLIRSYDTILVDEARRTETFDILGRLRCPKERDETQNNVY